MQDSILVPLDGSTFAEAALPVASSIARSLDIPLEVVRVHLAPTIGFSQDVFHATLDEDAEERANARTYLDRIVASLGGAGPRVRSTLLDARSVPDAVCARATVGRARMIVMTTHGRTGLRRTVLGSVADGIVKGSVVPVLLWSPRQSPTAVMPSVPFRRVLVPLDGSLEAEAILPHAVTLAALGATAVTLLRVIGHAISAVEPPAMVPISPFLAYSSSVNVIDEKATQRATEYATAYLDTVATRIRTVHPELTVETRVLVDERVDVALLDAARASNADLVAMTPQGQGTSRLIVGSTVDSVLRQWEGALLLLRPINQ